MLCLPPKMGKRGYEPRKFGQSLEARKGMEKDSSLESLERNGALPTPGF